MEFQYETRTVLNPVSFAFVCVKMFLAAFQMRTVERPKPEGYFDTRKARATSKFQRLAY